MELSHSCLLPLPSKLVFCYFGLPSQLLDGHLMLHLLHSQKIVLVGPGPVRKNLLAWSASAFKCSQAHTSAMDFPDISRSMYLLHILPRTNLSMSFFVLHGFGHLVHYDCLLRIKKYISFEFSWGCILLSIESQSLHCQAVLFLLCFNLGWACVSCRMIFFTPSIPI